MIEEKKKKCTVCNIWHCSKAKEMVTKRKRKRERQGNNDGTEMTPLMEEEEEDCVEMENKVIVVNMVLGGGCRMESSALKAWQPE